MDDSKKSREKAPESTDEIRIDPEDIAAAAAAAEEADAAALAAADAAMEKEFGPADGAVAKTEETSAGTPPEAGQPAGEGPKAEETPAETAPEGTAAAADAPKAEEGVPKPAPAPRDYNAEFTELLQAYPELKGKGVPDELVEQFKTSPRDVLSVYEHYMVAQLTKKVSDLETELSRARQNAETASRAPVVGSVGSAADSGGDEFLNSFNRYFSGY